MQNNIYQAILDGCNDARKNKKISRKSKDLRRRKRSLEIFSEIIHSLDNINYYPDNTINPIRFSCCGNTILDASIIKFPKVNNSVKFYYDPMQDYIRVTS